MLYDAYDVWDSLFGYVCIIMDSQVDLDERHFNISI